MAVTEPANAGLLRGPPAYAASTPWTPVWALLAGVFIVAASIVGAVLILGGFNMDTPIGMPGGGRWRPGDHDTAALATLAIWQVITVALTVLASTLFGGSAREVLALRTAVGAPTVYGKAILLMVVLQLTLSVVQYNLVAEDMFADLRPFVRLVGGSEWALALLVVGFGAPLSEELLFRGFLLSALARSRLGFAGGAVITSGLWTALHAGYSAAGIIEVFLIGLFFSWLLWRTGSLRVPIFCHALYNCLIVVVLRHVPLPT